MSGEKIYEIRSFSGSSFIGKRIFLGVSGTSKVFGSVEVEGSIGPLGANDWAMLRPGHRVKGPPLYRKAHAWKLAHAKCLAHPLRIQRKKGSVGLQVGPGY